MTDKTNGGPAFPAPQLQDVHLYALAAIDGITDSNERDLAYEKARSLAAGGMTLLDYFAGQAMMAAFGSGVFGVIAGITDDELRMHARLYYRMGRAMIEVKAEEQANA